MDKDAALLRRLSRFDSEWDPQVLRAVRILDIIRRYERRERGSIPRWPSKFCALLAELADAPDSKPGGRNVVPVRLRGGAPSLNLNPRLSSSDYERQQHTKSSNAGNATRHSGKQASKDASV